MKSKIAFLSSLILASWLLQFSGIWWIFVIPSIIFSWVFKLKKSIAYFYLGFVALFFLWTFQSLIMDWQNDHILSERVGTLMGGIGVYGIIIVTGLYGGIIAGLTSMLSAQIRNNYFSLNNRSNKMEEYLDLKDIKNMESGDKDKDFI